MTAAIIVASICTTLAIVTLAGLRFARETEPTQQKQPKLTRHVKRTIRKYERKAEHYERDAAEFETQVGEEYRASWRWEEAARLRAKAKHARETGELT